MTRSKESHIERTTHSISEEVEEDVYHLHYSFRDIKYPFWYLKFRSWNCTIIEVSDEEIWTCEGQGICLALYSIDFQVKMYNINALFLIFKCWCQYNKNENDYQVYEIYIIFLLSKIDWNYYISLLIYNFF